MRILLVEDKDSFRRLLVQALAGSDWDVLAVGDPQEALEALERSAFELMVTDLRLPGMSGMELLKRAKRRHPGIRIVLMSAFGEPRDIVEAVHSGADDFLPKPFDLDHFIELLTRLSALSEAPPPDPREPWIANSPVLRALDHDLAKAAEDSAPVLFLGEPGSGRSRAARRLHALRDSRAPFLSTHASTVGAEGIEARTLAMLNGGSLFLADLEDLPAGSIDGLLKSMDQSDGVRWMASARDAASLPASLRLRLGVLCFEIPRLTARKEDIVPLFRQFLENAARRVGRPTPIVERELERELLLRSWPGNVRALIWCVDRALEANPGLVLSSLPEMEPGCELLSLCWPDPGTLDAMLKSIEKDAEGWLLRRALKDVGGDPSKAASGLGLTVRAFAQRLKERGIPLDG